MRDTVLIRVLVGVVMLDQKSSELGWIGLSSNRSVFPPVNAIVALENLTEKLVEGCSFAVAEMNDEHFFDQNFMRN